ncbi:MAG TPA: cysteine desulfurase family protein [Candidatus Dormibacteraeota bacterium]|nr:cysteine desulfurase family protein [Candidatus Dormibacteraeota bacterium]
MRRVYLDNNATTPVLPEVFEAMRPFYLEQFGNASSIHHYGQHARGAVEKARASVAALLNARPAEIVFTSGGTEADNLGIFGLVQRGDHVITSTIEHSAVTNTCKRLEQMGCEVTFVPVNSRSEIDPEDVRKALRANTRLISIMMANNETGVIQPVEEIGKIAQEADVFFHTDAVQAAGKVEIDVKKIQCDALSISGHKIHAPQGTGALYIKKGTLIQPQIYGGSHERQRRAGTENLPGIVGIGKAAEISQHWLLRPLTPTPGVNGARESGGPAEMAAMRDRLQDAIVGSMEDVGVNGQGATRVPNTTNLWFDHIEGEALVIALDLKGLAVSSGAACSSGAIEPSHVLLAMGLPHQRARASIRISLGKQTTQEDIDFAMKVVPETVARLREISPVYQKQHAG